MVSAARKQVLEFVPFLVDFFRERRRAPALSIVPEKPVDALGEMAESEDSESDRILVRFDGGAPEGRSGVGGPEDSSAEGSGELDEFFDAEDDESRSVVGPALQEQSRPLRPVLGSFRVVRVLRASVECSRNTTDNPRSGIHSPCDSRYMLQLSSSTRIISVVCSSAAPGIRTDVIYQR
jgi:hypothetical protein